MLKQARQVIIPLIIVIIPSVISLADEKTQQVSQDKQTKLEEVIVTAPRIKNRADDIPSSITIINNEDIKASPFEKVEDILRATTGLDVKYHYASHWTAGNRPVNLRGTGSYGERTLVLVDGIPQNNAYNGWVEWSQIPKEAIERIEIMRGPASALYGSNAMGGVINIITKKPEAVSETTSQQNYGSMDTLLTKFVQDGRFGNFRYYLNGEYENTDGYIGTEPQKPYDIKRFSTEKRLFSRLIYEPDKHNTFTAGFSRYDAEKGGGRKYMYGYTENNRSWLAWSRDGEKIDWQASFRINDDEWTNFYDTPPTYNSLYRKELQPLFGSGGSLQSTINLLKKYILIVGVDYTHNDIETTDKYYTVVRSSGTEGKQTLIAPFLHNEVRFSDDKFIVNFGVRYDWIKSYDGKNHDTAPPAPLSPYDNDFISYKWRELSPKLGLVYHTDKNTTLKTSVGKAFRAPSLYELYANYIRSPLLIEANPQLQPEKILSYDLGIEHRFVDRLLAKLTIYQSHARDYIDYRIITPTHWTRDNITKVKIQGIEADLDWQLTNEWSTVVNYTTNKSQIIEYTTDPTVEDNYLAYTPRNVYRLGISYNKPDLLEFQAILNYNSKRYDDNKNTTKLESYSTVNLSLAKQFGKNRRISLGIDNIFDKEYTVYKGTSQDIVSPGRVVNLMLNLNF